jgi:2-keto-3-deoxy-L-fuconate dehydrogenase
VAARKAFIARQPIGRLGTPEEIAGMAVYLASDISAYATGTLMVVDGGVTL